jgi:hypothetical protein
VKGRGFAAEEGPLSIVYELMSEIFAGICRLGSRATASSSDEKRICGAEL